MDVLSNNIANVNTTGFKRGRAMFQDLFCQTIRHAQQAFGNYGGLNPMQVGLGVRLAAIDTLMEQGNLETTGKNTDLAIEGNGFFVEKDHNGNTFYSRDGNFNLNPNYDLVSTNTGFKLQGWLSVQDPKTGNLVLDNTGVPPYDLNIVRFLKKHAHQTNNVIYASNLDSSSDERDIKLGLDTLTFKDSTGEFQNLKFKFKKMDAENWLWTAYDESEGNVATGTIKADASGKIAASTVEPAGAQSTIPKPYFTYDPDGSPSPASASTLINAITDVGNGISSGVLATGNDVKDETVEVVFDGGDPTRATSYRVVGSVRGFIGAGTLGGTAAKIEGDAVNGTRWIGSDWTPTANVSMTFNFREDLDTTGNYRKNATTNLDIQFNAGTTYSTSQVLTTLNNSFKNNGIPATAYFDGNTRKFTILSNEVGSNRELSLIDNNPGGGQLADLGLIETAAPVRGTGGAKPEVFAYRTGDTVPGVPPNIVDFSTDNWSPGAGGLRFKVTDRDGHQAEVNFPDMVSGLPKTYSRGEIISTIQTAMATNNVAVSVDMVDTNGDDNPDCLALRGTRSGSGESIRIDAISGNLDEIGFSQGTYNGTAAVSAFDEGGLNFTLSEGTTHWVPNDSMKMTTFAAKGQADSVDIFVPQPGIKDMAFSTTNAKSGEVFQITGAVNKGATHTTSIAIHDSLGSPHQLVTDWEYTNKETKEWSYKVRYANEDPEIVKWVNDPGNGVVDPKSPTADELDRANDALIKNRRGTLFFYNNGKIDQGKSFVREVEMTPTGSNPLKVKLNMEMVTQFDSAFTTAAREQDGYEMGLLESMYFEQDGTVRGVYSNGQKQPIGQVSLATFNNPGGLEKRGKNLYEVSPNSGQALVGRPMQGERGTLNPGTLEMSNVDIAEEFTTMIITQRAFQANSRVITTSDELLQEVVNLKR
jgi:flagellar hook-basal body protein